MIAKPRQLHAADEQSLLPLVKELLQTVLHELVVDVVRKIPLSSDTVQTRMTKDVKDMLCNLLRSTEFSLELDESTLPGNEAIKLAYGHFIKDGHLMQEFSFARELKSDAKENEIPLRNIPIVAIYGATSMMGCHRGFVASLKEMLAEVLMPHCVIHWQPLAAKHLTYRLNESLIYVIVAINKIKICFVRSERKTAKNVVGFACTPKFAACLKPRFTNYLNPLFDFLKMKTFSLRDNLKSRAPDIAYLADFYFKFNDMNVQLQFPEVKRNADPYDSDIDMYCEHPQMLHDDFAFMAYCRWWCRIGYLMHFQLQKQILTLYPSLQSTVKGLLISFLSSSLAKRCSRVVTDLSTKQCNRL
ncbi:hypothetical protein M513_02760 [Trichuris suis]|uniref:Uncharacterized protein n=1 Tax=Trichuris suis TaxID=68888 RepID=A0A085MGF9_9BILA|nr:hypothetical protein M513_02760 [Trichuris suis]